MQLIDNSEASEGSDYDTGSLAYIVWVIPGLHPLPAAPVDAMQCAGVQKVCKPAALQLMGPNQPEDELARIRIGIRAGDDDANCIPQLLQPSTEAVCASKELKMRVDLGWAQQAVTQQAPWNFHGPQTITCQTISCELMISV